MTWHHEGLITPEERNTLYDWPPGGIGMSDSNPYDESLATELAKANARIDVLEAKLQEAEQRWQQSNHPCQLMRQQGQQGPQYGQPPWPVVWGAACPPK